MISTVTTTTVSTVTTTVGMATALGGIAVLTLIAFLVAKELASADGRPHLQTFSRVLNIAIIPLLVVFGAIVVANVVEAL
jgi:uncharacterized membrane protein